MVNFNFIDPSDNPLWYFLSFRKGTSISYQLAHYYLKLDNSSNKFYVPKDISNSSTKAWVATYVSKPTRNNPEDPLDISGEIFAPMPAYEIFTNDNWHQIDINIDLSFDLATWVLIDGIGDRTGGYELIQDEDPDGLFGNNDSQYRFVDIQNKKDKLPWFTPNGDYKDIVKNIANKIKQNFNNIYQNQNDIIFIPYGIKYDLDADESYTKISYYKIFNDNGNRQAQDVSLEIDDEFGYENSNDQNYLKFFLVKSS